MPAEAEQRLGFLLDEARRASLLDAGAWLGYACCHPRMVIRKKECLQIPLDKAGVSHAGVPCLAFSEPAAPAGSGPTAALSPAFLFFSMKFIALISGGKDSAFAALECQRLGHELVALGNLLPADEATQDLDSHMWQASRSIDRSDRSRIEESKQAPRVRASEAREHRRCDARALE